MRKALYPGSQEKNSPTDPLRLAQEYRVVLGQSALEDLIYELVRDNEWRPGPLHSRLVDLPWTDILTTNWDTLLERAAELTDREDTYDIIRTIGDIPRTHSPRIVKLHGSMPSNHPFIFTEEDYRTYPKTFAPFVNLVQQVLMENELCLIGFSGDDPNFVQWSGWIRDQLGDAARRIYLVGVLNLTGAHRKYLEARKVTLIDLAPLVEDLEGDDRHNQASSLFLEFLHSSKPKAAWDWRSEIQSIRSQHVLGLAISKSDTTELTKAFLGLVECWRKERESYPGWLICPSGDRTRIRDEIGNSEYVFRQVREHLSSPDESTALYEMNWRLDAAFLPMSEWFRGLLGDRIENASSGLTHQQRLGIAVILLRTAREERNRSSFDRWIAFTKESASSDPDAVAWVAYEQNLWARDSLDYPALATLLSNPVTHHIR
ncbi:MAG: SIR2 family protein [Candidatus Acidiferrales bacterium]